VRGGILAFEALIRHAAKKGKPYFRNAGLEFVGDIEELLRGFKK